MLVAGRLSAGGARLKRFTGRDAGRVLLPNHGGTRTREDPFPRASHTCQVSARMSCRHARYSALPAFAATSTRLARPLFLSWRKRKLNRLRQLLRLRSYAPGKL